MFVALETEHLCKFVSLVMTDDCTCPGEHYYVHVLDIIHSR